MRTSLLLLLALLCCHAQNFSQRGFFELRSRLYPQTAPDDSGRVIGESLLRYEVFYKPFAGLRFSAGIDARADTHRQALRDWHLSWLDRETGRPAFAVRRLSALYNRGPLTIELGKQFIRWGKADILNPTDRFAPRDYLEVVDNDFLAVTAGRLTWEQGPDTVDLVWVPLFTPSRTPLFRQRWVVTPGLPPGLEVRDLGARYPGGSQYGARWNRLGRGFEYSLSFYDGFNTLPLLAGGVERLPPRAEFVRLYPQMRMYGGDAAVPLTFLTLKAEAAYFTSSTPQASEYALYVIQLERQSGEWFFVGGYAGQAVTSSKGAPDFAPDRGLARAFLVRAGYTIDTNRSVALETAIRQNGKGLWTRLEYSHAFGQHWRAITQFSLIRGSSSDFLGQYRRNSHATVTLRYSF